MVVFAIQKLKYCVFPTDLATSNAKLAADAIGSVLSVDVRVAAVRAEEQLLVQPHDGLPWRVHQRT